MEHPYDPQHFADVYHTAMGRGLWAFLNRPETILRMETATFLGHPAIEPLSPAIEKELGPEAFEDRCKQMTGHAIRQIMGRLGYQLDKLDVRITTQGNHYTRGATYKPA